MRDRCLKAGVCVALFLFAIAASGWIGRWAERVAAPSLEAVRGSCAAVGRVMSGEDPSDVGDRFEGPLPDGLGFIEGERNVMSADGVVGYSVDLPVEDARSSFAWKAERSGWKCYPCEPTGLVCERGCGETRWAYAAFTSIGEETSVVVNYQTGG